MTRKALGRGLNALLREVETSSKGLEEIPIELIDPNPFQPRRTFPEGALLELANSIRTTGVLQPILVRRAAGRYQIVAGERRLRAARLAGMDRVPIVRRELSDNETLELALAENLLREDLNPLEVAHAYQMLIQRFNLSHEQVADRLGVSRSTVTNTLRLLRLAPKVQEYIAANKLTEGHARALAAIETQALQEEIAKVMIDRGLSVRQAEDLIAARPGGTGKKGKAKQQPSPVDPNVRAAVMELERTLGTRVRLVGSDARGHIEIKYFSAQDLTRIVEVILQK
jgi:ParB family transcriptional regulator, chromosome partitioning protein